jgi:hypothetical protein
MCDNYKYWPPIEEWIRDLFPNLRNGEYDETSDQTCLYNCIAWAAEDTSKWWWPSEDGFWPSGLPINDESAANFQQAFRITCDYEPCDNGELENGFQKIAIYMNGGRVKHIARQLESGSWTSKLGIGWDISHHLLDGLNCSQYGQVAAFMRRPRLALQ